MKVYVDELPKDCFECPCFKNDIELGCGLDDGSMDYFKDKIAGGECPLKTTKELKQQVVEEIIKAIDDKFNCLGYVEEKFEDIKKYILEQAKGD